MARDATKLSILIVMITDGHDNDFFLCGMFVQVVSRLTSVFYAFIEHTGTFSGTELKTVGVESLESAKKNPF